MTTSQGVERDGFTGTSPQSLNAAHGGRVAELPLLRCDPFDRMLVAQAQVEGASLVTVDPMVRKYDVNTLP